MDSLTPAGLAKIAHAPIFIGLLFNVFLFGVMTTQVYFYFTVYKRDPMWLRLFVITLLVLDSVNTAFDFTYLYECFITHYGDVEYISKVTWIFATDPALTGIISALVQFFFSWRVKVLTSSNTLALLVIALGFLGMGSALATSIKAGTVPAQFVDYRDYKPVVFGLSPQGKKTGFRNTDNTIDRIIRLTVQTGFVTSLCSMIDLVTFLALPHSGLHLVFNFPLCKLYTNSLMSSLNAREVPRLAEESTHHSTPDSPGLNVSHGMMPRFKRPDLTLSRSDSGPTTPTTGSAMEMSPESRYDIDEGIYYPWKSETKDSKVHIV